MSKNRLASLMKALRRGTYCFLAALLGVAAPCGAKTNQGGDEGATEQTLIKKLEYRRLPDVNIRKLLKEDRQALNRFEGGGLLPVRIAAPADAGPFTFKDFKWYGSESTGYIGLLGLKSKGALAQAVKIVHFDMPEGTKLWLYDPQQKFPAGPYAPTAGRENPAIWTPAVAGEKLVILIRSRVRPSAESDGLQIKTVMQTYRGAGEHSDHDDAAANAGESGHEFGTGCGAGDFEDHVGTGVFGFGLDEGGDVGGAGVLDL